MVQGAEGLCGKCPARSSTNLSSVPLTGRGLRLAKGLSRPGCRGFFLQTLHLRTYLPSTILLDFCAIRLSSNPCPRWCDSGGMNQVGRSQSVFWPELSSGIDGGKPCSRFGPAFQTRLQRSTSTPKICCSSRPGHLFLCTILATGFWPTSNSGWSGGLFLGLTSGFRRFRRFGR